MLGVLWVLAVLVALLGVIHGALVASVLPLSERVGVALPAVAVWALWSVGYLYGPRRRMATRAALARLVARLRRGV